MVVVFVVTVLLNVGDHVPVTLLLEVVGNVKAVSEQIEVGKVKVGLNLVLDSIRLVVFLEPITAGVVAPETTYTTRTLYCVLAEIVVGTVTVIDPVYVPLIGLVICKEPIVAGVELKLPVVVLS